MHLNSMHRCMVIYTVYCIYKHNYIPVFVFWLRGFTSNSEQGICLCTLFAICMQTTWLLSCHTRLLHNQEAISSEKALERTCNNSCHPVQLSTAEMSDVPHPIKDRRVACALRHARKWQMHLPSMLIKFEQSSIPCCCLRDFFID